MYLLFLFFLAIFCGAIVKFQVVPGPKLYKKQCTTNGLLHPISRDLNGAALVENNGPRDQIASPATSCPKIPILSDQVHENGNGYPETVIPVPEVDASMPELIPAEEEEGGEEEEEDEEADKGPDEDKPQAGNYSPPPGIEDARRAYEDLQKILKPKRKNGPGYVDPGFDPLTRERLEQMRQFLWNYVDPNTMAQGGTAGSSWVAASEQTAHALAKGNYLARKLRKWCHAFILDREDLPVNPYGKWNESILEDEGIAQEIKLHLQGIGKYVKAMDIVHFLDSPEMKKRLNRTKTIHLSTAQHWMHKMGYRWTTTPKGQYVDGHERVDVVTYRQDVFLPQLAAIKDKTRIWTKEGIEDQNSPFPPPNTRWTVVWYHDESTFYANDRRTQRWVPEDESAVPQPKGEGASLMVADFVSADYGWLRSPDGTEDAWVLFKAGKAREGYFTNKDILNVLVRRDQCSK
jgi:hypothetical protein